MITDIKTQVTALGKTIASSEDYLSILNDKKIITEYKTEQLEKTFQEILPRRYKRGLSNGLGSFIKDLTGNLDNQDLIDIQQAIDEVNKNQDTLNSQINSQIHINTQMINRLNSIQTFVNDNINRLQYEFNRTSQITNSIVLTILHDQHFFKINHIIEQLHTHLKDLLEIISLSKYQTISRHLLSENETKYIHDILEQDGVTLQNSQAMYNLLELKGFYNNTHLIFAIKIPTFHKDTFFHYQIKVIPHINKIIYPTPPEEIILNPFSYQYITNQCDTTYGTTYCKLLKLEPLEGTCIPALLGQLPAKCNFRETSRYIDIDYISYGKLYVQPAEEPIIYKSTCRQTTNKIYTQTLLEFKNCSITIDSQTYSTDEIEYKENFELHIPYNDVYTGFIMPELTLETLHNQTISNLNHTQILHKHAKFHSTSGHISLSLIILFTVVIIIIYLFFKRKMLQKIKIILASGLLEQPAATLRGEDLHNTPQQETTTKTIF